jgi:hypothetical protein
MFPIRSWIVVALEMTALFWGPVRSAAQDSQVQAQAVAAADPVRAAALAQVQPGQAIIIYENDELAIAARGSSLVNVLQEVCRQIGAELDAPADAKEVTTGLFGPGPTRDVLVSLLKASPYELGMAASVDNAQAISKVVVLPKSKDSNGHSRNDPTAANSTDNPVTQPPIDSKISGEKASTQQMMELLAGAKANFVDNEAEPGDPQSEIFEAQTGEIFKALEGIIEINAAMEASGAIPTTVPKKDDSGSPAPAIMRKRRYD